jgi:xanthine dehydrogenase accessory factor
MGMDIYNIVAEIAKNPVRSVLATIVSVQGHAYRKEGAMMLLMENGLTIGSISPGCMEADLLERVQVILSTNTSQLVQYDMSEDDVLWGETIGCGGSVQVLLEPVVGELLENMIEIKRKLDQGADVQLIRLIENEGLNIQYKLVPFANDSVEFRRVLGQEGKSTMYKMLFSPKPRLIIFGAGNDTRPIAELARKSGFHLVVADWRSDLCTNERIEGAEFVIGFPKKAMINLRLNEKDFVIVMSHHLRWDREFLQEICKLRLRYIGVMGSKTRCKQLLIDLIVPEWLHAPIGLGIGADGPEEIAVSILAELIQVKRANQKAKHLDKDGIHETKHSGDLFGRGKKQSDGASEAFHRALEG